LVTITVTTYFKQELTAKSKYYSQNSSRFEDQWK